MAAIDSTSQLTELLDKWEKENAIPHDIIKVLTSIAELIEKETESYLKMDPDPFDDRHPSRAHPDCTFGHVLKLLFKNDDFMNKLVNNYVMHRENRELNTVACRLLLDICPGLETSVVFQDTEGLVQRLFSWAENAHNPLQSYSVGLLAAAMEVQDIAANFREQNSHLVPVMLKRLRNLSQQENNFESKDSTKDLISERPFAHLNGKNREAAEEKDTQTTKSPEKRKTPTRRQSVSPGRAGNAVITPINPSESSNSSWADLEPYMIGSYQMHPLTSIMQQRFILQYLTPMGEYQEVLSYVYEHNALSLIFHYINLKENHDVRLAFEALKYLAALLCHKKFAIEFVNMGGVQRLLQVYRPSIAATGVSMCLYYLAYNEDAMERVCLLPQHVLSDLVKYSLWLMECSHDSSRCHATMFFGFTFGFRVILDLFDAQDGLRKLFNMMSTLDIFVVDSVSQITLSDDQVFSSRQTARHVSVALKRYYEAHLATKAEQLRRSHSRNQGGSPHPTTPPYKATRFSSEAVLENVETLLELIPLRVKWEPVDELIKLGGVPLLLQLVAMSYEWNYSGRAETVRCALDVLTVCSVTPKTQLALCDSVQVMENQNTVGMSVVLAACEGEIVSDPEVQRSALNVIINCACGPMSRLGGTVGRVTGMTTKKRSSMKSGEDLLSKMWNCIRSNNGIMILLNLLSIKVPITDADSIRTLACKALNGLARNDTVKQIISKLPLFSSGQLQVLMREPVLQDKRHEHIKFCKHGIELMERVTGAPLTTGIETSISKINKAEVVAQTKIIFHDKDLLQLIHQHLVNKGLNESAGILQKEATLPTIPRTLFSAGQGGRMITCTPPTKLSRPIVTATCATHVSGTQPSQERLPSSPSNSVLSNLPQTSTSSPTFGHIKINLSRTQNLQTKSNKVTALQKSQSCSGSYQQSPVLKKQPLTNLALKNLSGSTSISVTLDSIVTEYLRKQHALCKNPVVTCPPFDLFVPHQCPEPQYRNVAPVSIAARIQRREISPKYGGYDGARLNRKFIYSRFRPVRTYRDSDGSSSFTCCAFSTCDQFLFLGTLAGELKVYNIHTGNEETTYNCHESELTHCEPSRDGKLLLTSSAWRRPLSALWTFTDVFEMKYSFEEDYYIEFSKLSQDKIIGTKYETAHIYDALTGQRLMVLRDPDLSNNYTKNRATFDPTDELVLSDGVLWDFRSGSAIHKFDKFNPHINGIFHPNGLEIISNSEIWDLRTFHLLHTVPALDQCQITFTKMGDVMYGAMLEEDEEVDEDQLKSPYGSSFRTFDATDYSSIATIDIKKNIFDLATDRTDCFLAIVEQNQMSRDCVSSSESVCRLYEVGRNREGDDEEDNDDEDDEEDESDDDDESEDADVDLTEDNEVNDSDNADPPDDEDLEEMELTDDSNSDDSSDDQVLFALNSV